MRVYTRTMITTTCACTMSRRAARALTRVYDEALAASGLKVTQFSLLRTLQRTGDLHITGLARMTGLERSTLGRNLRLLEVAGLVSLSEGRDGRERLIVLTQAGSTAIAAAMPLWQRAQARVAGHLGEDRRQLLFSLLGEMAAIVPAPRGDDEGTARRR